MFVYVSSITHVVLVLVLVIGVSVGDSIMIGAKFECVWWWCPCMCLGVLVCCVMCVVVFSDVGVGSGADSAHLSSVLVGVKRGDAAFSVGVVVS